MEIRSALKPVKMLLRMAAQTLEIIEQEKNEIHLIFAVGRL